MEKTTKLFLIILLIIGLLSCYNNVTQSNFGTDSTAASNSEIFVEQIKSGDFSNVRTANNEEMDEQTIEELNRRYDGDIDWADYDLHREGISGLIWQSENDRAGENGEIKRIMAAFAIDDDGAKLIFLPSLLEFKSFYFLGKDGKNIIFYYYQYGTVDYDRFTRYIFDDDLNIKQDYRLSVFRNYDWVIEEAKEDGWYESELENAPYMAAAGIYYYANTFEHAEKYASDEEWSFTETHKALEEKQFLEEFYAMTGYSFYSDNPLKPD